MLFKNLFKSCEHEYKYFHCESIPRNSFVHSCQHKFSFICTKCEKVFTVTEDELRADYEAYQKEVNRRSAIGKPYELESSTLTLKTFGAGLIQFSGIACTVLMNKYKFLNLKEIEPVRHSYCEGPMSYAKGETL
jgi:hypothetical protein